MKSTLTTCPFCGVGCNFYLESEGDRILGVAPSRQHAVSRGRLCIKGWTSPEFTVHPDRLKRPLIRKNGKLKEASWQAAYALIVKNIKKIKVKYGPEAFGVISSARCTNEENYLIQKFGRACLGTNNIDHCARTCHVPSVTGLTRSFGSGAATNSIDELPEAKCILIIGSNPTEAHPIIGWRLITARDKGAKIILADPRSITMSAFSDLHLKLLPGTDICLLNGMMREILAQGWEDKGFIQERTEGFDELKKVLEKYTPEYVEKITRVPQEILVKAAKIYATSGPASIIYSLGITEHTTGTDNVSSLANLAMLTGNVGKPSCGVNPLRGQNNVQGSCDMGALPNVFSGYQDVEDAQAREKFEKAWKVRLPAKKGLTNSDMFTEPGKIKLFYIIGEDVVHSEPNSKQVATCLKKAEFVVMHDLFLCKSAEYADVVLPASSFLEKEGTFTNADRRIQRVRKAYTPRFETKPDGQIIMELSGLLGYPMKYKNASAVMDEIARLSPLFAGVSYERLEKAGFLQWPCPDKNHPGTKILHQGRFSRGKGKFFAIEHKPPQEVPDVDFPFVLSTGRILFHYNSGTQTRRTTILSREFPENFVQINFQDAKRLKIINKSKVTVSTRRGALTVKAVVTDAIIPGVIWMPFHYADKLTNILTNDAFDPISKIGEYKACAAKIEPASQLVIAGIKVKKCCCPLL
jgi:formate dehydrogenase alpha subunit